MVVKEKDIIEVQENIKGWIPFLIGNRSGNLISPFISKAAKNSVVKSLALSFCEHVEFVTKKLRSEIDKLKTENKKLKKQGLKCCGKKLTLIGYATFKCSICDNTHFLLNVGFKGKELLNKYYKDKK